jgi:hypothetical protein
MWRYSTSNGWRVLGVGWAMIRILAASRHRSLDVDSYNVHPVPFLPAKLKPLLPLANYLFSGAALLPVPPDWNLSLDILEGEAPCCRDPEKRSQVVSRDRDKETLVLKKQISVGVMAAGLACGIGSAALAQSAHGTTNSTLGSSGAATGTNGALHSGANKALNGAKSDTTGTVLPPANRSATGTTNSTLGASGAATGTNGKLHSGANKALKETR